MSAPLKQQIEALLCQPAGDGLSEEELRAEIESAVGQVYNDVEVAIEDLGLILPDELLAQFKTGEVATPIASPLTELASAREYYEEAYISDDLGTFTVYFKPYARRVFVDANGTPFQFLFADFDRTTASGTGTGTGTE